MTVGNFLLDSQNQLKNYVGNEDLSSQVKNKSFHELFRYEFSIHGWQTENKISKAVTRRQFFNKTAVLLSIKLPVLNPTHFIIKDVLECMCSIQDLITI